MIQLMIRKNENSDQLTTRKVRKDLRTLATFVEMYCESHHADDPDRVSRGRLGPVVLRNVRRVDPVLCPDCAKLLTHAFVKRIHCPMEPNKPACKHCPQHCYHPRYREGIREIMRDSGKRLVMGGRIDYLWHLLF